MAIFGWRMTQTREATRRGFTRVRCEATQWSIRTQHDVRRSRISPTLTRDEPAWHYPPAELEDARATKSERLTAIAIGIQGGIA